MFVNDSEESPGVWLQIEFMIKFGFMKKNCWEGEWNKRKGGRKETEDGSNLVNGEKETIIQGSGWSLK